MHKTQSPISVSCDATPSSQHQVFFFFPRWHDSWTFDDSPGLSRVSPELVLVHLYRRREVGVECRTTSDSNGLGWTGTCVSTGCIRFGAGNATVGQGTGIFTSTVGLLTSTSTAGTSHALNCATEGAGRYCYCTYGSMYIRVQQNGTTWIKSIHARRNRKKHPWMCTMPFVAASAPRRARKPKGD